MHQTSDFLLYNNLFIYQVLCTLIDVLFTLSYYFMLKQIADTHSSTLNFGELKYFVDVLPFQY